MIILCFVRTAGQTGSAVILAPCNPELWYICEMKAPVAVVNPVAPSVYY